MKAYKVTRIERHGADDIYLSTVAWQKSWVRRYEVDRPEMFTLEDGLGMAFDTFEAARAFMRQGIGELNIVYVAWEADVTVSDVAVKSIGSVFAAPYWRTFWEDGWYRYNASEDWSCPVSSFPEGTIFCEEITIRRMM